MTRRKQNVLDKNNLEIISIVPKTDSQKTVFESNKNLLLHGCAGTGKTFISLYLALKEVYREKYEKIIIIRSAVATRKIGFLPGSEVEKARVYEQPYIGIFQELFHRDDAYDISKTKGLVKFITTSYIRGVTFNDSIIIVDECQNMSFHELDSIITRFGDNCRIIFCGDTFQADLKDEGVTSFMDILKRMDEFDFVEFTLEDIVRSDLVKNYLTIKYTP